MCFHGTIGFSYGGSLERFILVKVELKEPDTYLIQHPGSHSGL